MNRTFSIKSHQGVGRSYWIWSSSGNLMSLMSNKDHSSGQLKWTVANFAIENQFVIETEIDEQHLNQT